MSTPAEKVQYLNETKAAIKDAIEAKGVTVEEGATFRSYADRIAEIKSGGGGVIVTFTFDYDIWQYRPDCDFQEVYDAIQAGTYVVADYPENDDILPVVFYDEYSITFARSTLYETYEIGWSREENVAFVGQHPRTPDILAIYAGTSEDTVAERDCQSLYNSFSASIPVTACGGFMINGEEQLISLPLVGFNYSGPDEPSEAIFSVISDISGTVAMYKIVIGRNYELTKTITPLGGGSYPASEEVEF